jgi:hypothetical protein
MTPAIFNKEKMDNIMKTGLAFILISSLVCINHLSAQPAFIKKVNIGNEEIVLYADGSWQYARKFDVTKMFSENEVFRPTYSENTCKEIFCIYPTQSKRFYGLNLFSAKDIHQQSILNEGSREYYRELSKDSFSQVRYKYKSHDVNCFINGMRKEMFLLDSNQKAYLVKIFHQQGVETWYYPIYNPSSSDHKDTGSLLGISGGNYFVELRFRNHSLDLLGFCRPTSYSKDSMILIERESIDIKDDPLRLKSFIQSMKLNFHSPEKTDDFEKLLENEMKKNPK